ncbi:MAG: flagellar basal body L-ring protein FlgH [Candidatus Wallbacteria bacterium]|nr:flagellar basal body L-ring protein FlgH [Candidatus Wallbacteria bacterium]
MIRLIFLIFLISQWAIGAESLWRDDFSLYSEHKARKTGDVVTVLIVENASAQQRASTTNKESMNGNVQTGSGFMKFIPLGGANTSTSYNGNGTTTRNNSFSATVTARIVEVLPNGTYRIEGRRKLNLNNEVEEISVYGLVRDEDIDRENTIESNRLAEARIEYQGKGVVTDSQKPGLIQRLLQAIF